jgi:uncharacterized protein (TIGR02118 family)
MTVKLMAFLKAAPGLSREQFVDYYETRHVPLVKGIMPGIIDYRRNYLAEAVGGFDVVTEVWFEDREVFEHAMRLATSEPGAARIAEDEANFLDRSATVVAFPDEQGGPVDR